jgi:hypothetical protein
VLKSFKTMKKHFEALELEDFEYKVATTYRVAGV